MLTEMINEYIVPEGTKILRKNDLAGHENNRIVLPSSLKKIEEGAFSHGSKLMSVRFSGNDFYTFENGFLIERKTGSLTAYLGHASVIQIPDEICMIESWAFYECQADRIVFPKAIDEIHEEAFTTCRIREAFFAMWNAHIFFPKTDIRLRQYLLGLFGQNEMFDFARYDEGIAAGYLEPDRLREITARLKWPYALSEEYEEDYRKVLGGNLNKIVTVLAAAGDLETLHWLCDLDVINSENKEEVLTVLHSFSDLHAYMDLCRYMKKTNKDSFFDFSI